MYLVVHSIDIASLFFCPNYDLVGENTEQDVVPAICCQKEVAGFSES